MKLGLALSGPLAAAGATAARAEAAGFESVWALELDRTAFGIAVAAINSTSRITVGTAVTLAFPRSPTITAMEAWDLDELSGERFVLGLGSQVKHVMEARFSVGFERPAARLAEYVQAVRTIWAANRGEPVTHEGAFYRITMPTFHGPPRPERRDVPIGLAAVGPLMARTAGRVADALVGHPIASPRYLAEVVAPARDAGAAEAGRPATACPISAAVIVAIDPDPDRARREARLQIAFYATTRAYRQILVLHGRAALQPALRRAFVRRDLETLGGLIDDELLDQIAVAGSPDEVRDRLAGWQGAEERVVLSPPWYMVSPERSADLVAAVIDTFRTAGEP